MLFSHVPLVVIVMVVIYSNLIGICFACMNFTLNHTEIVQRFTLSNKFYDIIAIVSERE